MELATNPPAARLPAAWYAWWSLPAAICMAMAVVMAVGPAGGRPAVLLVGVAVTAAAAVCVERLLNCELRARRAALEHQAQTAGEREEARQRLVTMEARHATEVASLREQLSGLTELHKAQLVRIAEEFLPRAVDDLRAGQAMDDLLRPLAKDPDIPDDFRPTLRKLLRFAMLAIEEEFDRSSSARHSVVSIGSRMQVYTSKLRAQLHEMQGVHGNLPAVAQDLMELDQELGPADCLAASIVVLGGASRPGRTWQTPQPLISVVRGGMGRIKEYRRVKLRRLPELAVDGGLVDHLTLILAHLMDNGTRYSPPAETVFVSAREVPNGLGIEVQDAGTGLRAEKRRQALRLLNGVAVGAGPGDLAEDAQLGLRVVGNLARKYGITVTFDDSPWLGTAAVVVVPNKYIKPLDGPRYPDPPSVRAAMARRRAQAVKPAPSPTQIPSPSPATSPAPPTSPSPAPAPSPAPEPAIPAPPVGRENRPVFDDDDDALVSGTTPGGLPKRSKSATGSRGPGNGLHTGLADTSSVPPEESFTGLAAFVSGCSPTKAHDSANTPGSVNTSRSGSVDVSGNGSQSASGNGSQSAAGRCPAGPSDPHDRPDEQAESD
ncbi:ATP-binding protein [Streptomyces sp. NPDC053499]|uniref:ATP-binding protein n=1 Tax=Streptomyces sp. NPDC053499 TaxID=3365707 RepID=UPI0037CFC8DC